MKKLFSLLLPLVVLIYLLGLANRVTGQPIFPHSDNASISGNWVLVPILASDTITGKIPSINFNLAGGKFTGFTGCNQMSGGFIQHGNKLSFNRQLIVTRMVCQGYNEKQFIANLLRVTNYKIENEVLVLMVGSTPISKWMRRTDRNIL